MYSTCIHCYAKLGENSRVEKFSTGERLAFDGAKGRLWVVCPACARWNLTPVEERWEAIEECERLYRGTRLRVSTDNIGLARLPGGLDLVRIGAPQQPEMAGWRYGRELVRRWRVRTRVREHWGLAMASIGSIGLGAEIVGFEMPPGPGRVAVGVGTWVLLIGAYIWGEVHDSRQANMRLVLPTGRVMPMGAFKGSTISLRAAPGAEQGVALYVVDNDKPSATLSATGAARDRMLRVVLAASNYEGAKPADVDSAVAALQAAGGATPYIRRVVRAAERSGLSEVRQYPDEVLLSLEMALHEDSERRALDADLTLLRAEWELADQIAAIADNLVSTVSLDAFQRQHSIERGGT